MSGATQSGTDFVNANFKVGKIYSYGRYEGIIESAYMGTCAMFSVPGDTQPVNLVPVDDEATLQQLLNTHMS